jgi:general stress protein YciG
MHPQSPLDVISPGTTDPPGRPQVTTPAALAREPERSDFMSSMDEREPTLRAEEEQASNGPESGLHGPESGERSLRHGDPRGFAAMEEAKQRQIASKGGKAAHEKGTAHEFTPEEARLAGKKGGEAVSKNREHMAEIGRKGGERVSQDREHMAQIGRRGGEAVSGDREHMAEIGRKGGEARSEH